MSDNKVEHTISLKDDTKDIVIVFESKDVKEKYISSEYTFSKAETLNRMSACGATEINNAITELNAMHIKHAKAMGYNPVGYEGKRWYYNPVTPDKTFA